MDNISNLPDYSYDDYLEEELQKLEEEELKRKGLLISLLGY